MIIKMWLLKVLYGYKYLLKKWLNRTGVDLTKLVKWTWDSEFLLTLADRFIRDGFEYRNMHNCEL